MTKPAPRKVTNAKFTDPEWYVSLAADILDLKFATLAKDLGKALKPEVVDAAKELVELYQLAFDNTLQLHDIKAKVTIKKGSEALFSDHIIDPNFPSYHPVFQHLLNRVEQSYINQHSDQFIQPWSEVSRLIRQDFSLNFTSMVQSADKAHVNAAKYIEQLKTFVVPTESKVMAHMNAVLVDVEHESLAIDPDLVLRKSYVTPTCKVRFEQTQQGAGKTKEDSNIIQALIERVSGKANYPIVIHGQPGHGKTSTVKMLVSALAQTFQRDEKPLSVLFYEFKNLRALSDPILKVLNSETAFIEDETFFEAKHTVLILDGLDERQLADGSDDTLKGFVSGLFRLADRVNRLAGSKLSLILTGRSQYVAQIKQSFNTDHWIFEIEDFSDDKMQLWLERFNGQKNGIEPITIEQLNDYHLQDLMPQPILLAISSIMLCDNEGKKLIDELDHNTINRTAIYDTIIRWSHKKRWQTKPTESLNDSLDFDDYLVLLQAIAFEMFKTGDESIKLSALAPALQNSVFDLDFLNNKSVENIEVLCSQLRISFFFKGVEDKAFSFLHKSIKDFLIVSGIVDALVVLLDGCNIKKLDKEADELYEIFGHANLSSEDHIPMLEQWVHHKADKFTPNREKLMAIWERVGKQDFAVSFDTPGQAVTTQRNMLHNYYQLISRYFPLLSADENEILFGNDDGKVVLFNSDEDSRWRLMDSKVFCDTVIMDFDTKLSFKNQLIRDCGFDVTVFSLRMIEHNFSNCIIIGAFADDSNFWQCDFKSVKILGNHFHNSVFNNCDFHDATIDCISTNAGNDAFPSELTFYNRFLNCNFANASLSGHYSSGCFGKTQFLFWNCKFDSANFEVKKCSTIRYSDDFKGVRISDIEDEE